MPKGCSLIGTWSTSDFQVALEMPAWPSSQQAVGCHRPCFNSRVDLWYLASTALVKSSLFLLLLPSALYVSSYGCLGSWPQNCTWKLQALSSVWKHTPVPKFLLDRRCHTKISRKPHVCLNISGPNKKKGLAHFGRFGTIHFISVSCYKLHSHCLSVMWGRKPGEILLLTWSAFIP